MKRLMVLMLVAIFALSTVGFAAGKAPVKKKVAKKPVVSDQLLIKKAVLVWSAARSKEKPYSLNRVRFVPIKIANGWAVTTYDLLDSHGRVIPGDGPQYILKKSRGKWRVIIITTEYNLYPKTAAKIGLSKDTAKKLGITLESYG